MFYELNFQGLRAGYKVIMHIKTLTPQELDTDVYTDTHVSLSAPS